MITVHYINSMNEHFRIELSTHNPLQSLMVVILENDFEDWGECLGRAWCRTCHVSLDREIHGQTNSHKDNIEKDEAIALNLLSNRVPNSRLACQIIIDETLDGATLTYLGDN